MLCLTYQNSVNLLLTPVRSLRQRLCSLSHDITMKTKQVVQDNASYTQRATVLVRAVGDIVIVSLTAVKKNSLT